MRKFFCLSAGLAACSVAGLATAGGPQLQTAHKGIEVTPIRMAQISPEGKLTSPWVYTKDLQGVDSTCGDDTLWDGFDYNTPDGGPENGDLCFTYFGPSTRWFFGPSYCNTWGLNDITSLAAGAADGSLSDHAKFAWFWYGDGNPNGSEQCFLVTFTYEDFDTTCNGPAAANGYSGIILDFGLLATNPGGYYWTNVNTLCSAGLSYQMPMDGSGGYDMQQWNFFDGSNFSFATCGQPMLWGQRDTAAQGSQTEFQWDDDTDIDSLGNCTTDVNGNCLNLPDGTLQAPFECYTYAFGLCPDPLGAMAAFLGTAGPTDCLGLEVDQLVGGASSTWTITDPLGSNATVALVYGFQDGATNVNGQFGYCASFGIKGVSQSKLLCQGKLSAGVKTCKKPIPVSAVGKRVLTQAAMRDTCPDQCMSNVLDMTVQ